MSPHIRLENITKLYSGTPALYDVSVNLPVGATIGLVGPNGAGKTTLMCILAGLIQPSSGEQYLNLKKPTFAPAVSFAPQDPAFPDRGTILSHFQHYARLQGIPPQMREAEIRRVLDAVELWGERGKKGSALSHGMKKRACVAQALLGSPPLVLLDEPTAGMDPENARRLRDLVRAKSPAQTIVLSSHNLSEIEDACDHLLILSKGSVQDERSMASFTGANDSIRVEFEGNPSAELRRAIEAMEGVSGVTSPRAGNGANLQIRCAPEHLQTLMKDVLEAAIAHGSKVMSIQRGSRLEDEFLDATKT